jgi:hypothetical protein
MRSIYQRETLMRFRGILLRLQLDPLTRPPECLTFSLGTFARGHTDNNCFWVHCFRSG